MRSLIVLLFITVFGLDFATAADLTTAQRKVAKQIADLVVSAGSQYQAGDFDAAGKNLDSAIGAIDEAMKDSRPELFDAIAPAFTRITKATALLELEGVLVRPFTAPTRPEAVAKKPAAKPAPRPVKPAATAPLPSPANPFAAGVEPISFAKTVAPILVGHCGRCHITGSKGDFSMATFASLAKGPPEGRVIFPGDVAASRLIETIENGDMPRGGDKVPPASLKILKDWIAGGARYDGPSPDVPLTAFTAGEATTPAPRMAAPPVKRATGNETVSFSKDIAPLLLKNCNGCHIDAMQDRGGLRMDTFALILRGGDSGAIVNASKSAMSLLVRKLKGEEGDRMPAGGRPPLSSESITLISRWIDEGAPLDGDNENQPLSVMASLAWMKTASDDEISARRQQQAIQNLTLVSGAVPKSSGVESERFLIVGDIGEGTARAVASAADEAWKHITPWVKTDTLRGRITVFVMPRRYDYSEFAKMVEQRSLPSDWQSHWRYDGIDAYVTLVAASGDSDETIMARLVAPLASVATAMRGTSVPRWFAEGVGRAVAAKTVMRELPAVEGWNRDAPSAIASMRDGNQFVKNELPPEQADLVSYGLVSVMLSRTQRKQYDALLRALPTANSFDAAFGQAFGVSAADFVSRYKLYVATAK